MIVTFLYVWVRDVVCPSEENKSKGKVDNEGPLELLSTLFK